MVSAYLYVWQLYLLVRLHYLLRPYFYYLGYHNYPFLIQTVRPPDLERLVELREEVLDLDRRERQLEFELANLPPEGDLEVSSDSDT